MENSTSKVLFVCYGNSCRSILAEALARHFWGDDLEAASAGLVPLEFITPYTLVALAEAGIPADGLFSKGLSDVRLEDMDYLVNLTGLELGGKLPPSFSGKLISHYVRDPYGEGLEAFRNARIELEWLVKVKLPELIAAKKSGS